MEIGTVRQRALKFEVSLSRAKQACGTGAFEWYPYGTLNNFVHLDNLLTGENRHLLSRLQRRRVADIGAADGDLAFFLETLGFEVDIIDNPPTNLNGLQGARAVKSALASQANIHEIDLDAQFRMPLERYDVVFLLGTLYHLRNPYYVLEAIARHARYCFLSTRITKYANDGRTLLLGLPVAYLLDAGEANNDPTNYWIFSDAGLRRILHRTGWDVLDYMMVGNVAQADPVTNEGDARAFCLLESRAFSGPTES